MRNPLNSWDKSDSYFGCGENKCRRCTDYCDWREQNYILGENDLGLMRKLFKAGNEHRKYLRQIFVSMDITAPLYWWKEFDTYKVATVANSCSTMHKIQAKEFTRQDFSCDRMDEGGLHMLDSIISFLESERQKYLQNTENRTPWHNMIQILPTSYNQMRTVTLNYETLINIYYARKAHKLQEWHTFCDTIASLPYADTLILVK